MPVGTKNQQIEGGGVHHIALHTNDLEKSVAFYRDVLGMELVAEFGGDRKIALMDVGDGSHFELFQPTGDTIQPENNLFFHIALTTTDIEAAVEKVRQAGCKITVEPKDVTLAAIEATIAFFIGPNGETIEFFQVNN